MASALYIKIGIRTVGPEFRNVHDKVAYTINAAFMSAGYYLQATGTPAFADNALFSPFTDEVSKKNWNEFDDKYAFLLTHGKRHESPAPWNVLVKCFVINDHYLLVHVTSEGDSEPIHLQLNVTEYVDDYRGGIFAEDFKNLGKLVDDLNREIFHKLDGSLRWVDRKLIDYQEMLSHGDKGNVALRGVCGIWGYDGYMLASEIYDKYGIGWGDDRDVVVRGDDRDVVVRGDDRDVVVREDDEDTVRVDVPEDLYASPPPRGLDMVGCGDDGNMVVPRDDGYMLCPGECDGRRANDGDMVVCGDNKDIVRVDIPEDLYASPPPTGNSFGLCVGCGLAFISISAAAIAASHWGYLLSLRGLLPFDLSIISFLYSSSSKLGGRVAMFNYELFVVMLAFVGQMIVIMVEWAQHGKLKWMKHTAIILALFCYIFLRFLC